MIIIFPVEVLGEGGELEDVRGRQGKVPDFRFRLPLPSNGQNCVGAETDTLAELKVINAGVSRYPRGGPAGKEKAVERRARTASSLMLWRGREGHLWSASTLTQNSRGWWWEHLGR